AHISERNTVYAEADLLTTAMAFASKAGLNAVEQEITLAKKDGRLLPAKDQSGKHDLLTDEQSLSIERDLSRLYRMGTRQKGLKLKAYGSGERAVNIKPEIALQQRLGRTTLSDGQKEAVLTALTGKGQVVGVQGYAGTGKTFMLSKLAGEAERAGYKIEGLAPSAQATQQLKEALPASETLQARLLRQRSPDQTADPRKTILVVDEASMVSNTQMKSLLDQARDQKIARVVLVGDVQQLDAVAAGTPFALMQKLGMRTAVMDDIQRQRNEDVLAVVNHAIAGEVRQAFDRIGNNVLTSNDIAKSAAYTYLSIRRRERAGLGLVTPSNKTRITINATVREGLRAEGILHGPEHQLQTLSPQRLSRVEAADPNSYKLGDVVIAHQSVASAGLTKGRQYNVIEVDPREGRVLLQDRETGTTLPFAPTQNSKAATAVDAYEKTTKDFALGDQVKFRIADKSHDIENGETGKIRAITEERITIKTRDGDTKELDRNTLAAAGMDHAYALTAHDFQGATVDKIIVAMSANERLADQKNFYVSVSRARDEVTLITDRPDDLARRLEEQTGEKVTALETWLEAERDKAREQRHDQSDARETCDQGETRAQETPQREPDQSAKSPEREDPEKAPDKRMTELERTTRELEKLIQKQLGDYER
ncbi:MAG: AAA family ATPase, partial [Paracoccaceae bacterium]|nr:AAA family ATPase [Paracoccaceae bacterium]